MSVWRGVFIGAGVGVAFIVLSLASVGAVLLGLPSIPQSLATAGKFIVVVFAAAVIEEALFRGVLLSVFRGFMPQWVAVAAQAVLFGFAHTAAYGTIGGSGAIIGAMVFGALAGGVFLYSGSLIAAMTLHAVVNAWLVYGHLVSFG